MQVQISKITEIGDIPKEWNIAKLDDAKLSGNDTFVDGPFGSNLKVSDYTKSGIMLIQLQNIGEGIFLTENKKFTSEEKYVQLKRHATKPGDIVIAKMSEPVSRACIVPPINDRFLVVADCVKLRVNEERFDKFFLTYVINSDVVRKQAIERSTGSTRLRINLSHIKELKIPYPPLQEQQKIASILSNVDTLIQKTDQIIEQTQRLKKGLMQRLLTKGIGYTKFKITELGDIPEEWNIKQVVDIAEIRGRVGWKGYTTKDFRKKGEGPISLGVINIDQENRLNLNEMTFVSWEKYYESPDIHASKGDILLVQRGSTIGKVALIDKDLDKATINPNLVLIKNIKIKPDFLFYTLNSNLIKEQITGSISSTSIPLLTQKQIKDLELPVPPLSEQQKIVSILSNVDNLIQKLKEKRKDETSLKKGLMQQLLTGKIRVKV